MQGGRGKKTGKGKISRPICPPAFAEKPLQFGEIQAKIGYGNMKRGRPPCAANTRRPCTSDGTTQHSSFYCTTRLLYPFSRPFARADSEDAGTGRGRAFAYPKRYAVLSLRLGTAFMFPADAQPGGEVPHTRRLPPPFLSSLPGGAPRRSEKPSPKAPRPKDAGPHTVRTRENPPGGMCAKKRGSIVKVYNANVCISAADELKLTVFGAILKLL